MAQGSRLAAGEEGTVLVRATFDVKGVPEVIYVESSSRYPALDKAATDAVPSRFPLKAQGISRGA